MIGDHGDLSRSFKTDHESRAQFSRSVLMIIHDQKHHDALHQDHFK
jgi:hypothetical protein